MSPETSVILEFAKAIVQGGVFAVFAFLLLWIGGKKLDAHTAIIARLCTLIEVLLDRRARETKIYDGKSQAENEKHHHRNTDPDARQA